MKAIKWRIVVFIVITYKHLVKLNTYNERVKSLCLEYYKNHQVKSIQMLNDFKILGVNQEAV